MYQDSFGTILDHRFSLLSWSPFCSLSMLGAWEAPKVLSILQYISIYKLKIESCLH